MESTIEILNTEDDFGNKCERKYISMHTIDFEYSNQYVYRMEGFCVYLSFFPQSDMKQIRFSIVLYKYRRPLKFHNFPITVAFMVNNNKPVCLSTSWTTESSSFVLCENEYEQVIDAFKKNNKIRFIVKGVGSESKDFYDFTINYNKWTFNDCLKQLEK